MTSLSLRALLKDSLRCILRPECSFQRQASYYKHYTLCDPLSWATDRSECCNTPPVNLSSSMWENVGFQELLPVSGVLNSVISLQECNGRVSSYQSKSMIGLSGFSVDP